MNLNEPKCSSLQAITRQCKLSAASSPLYLQLSDCITLSSIRLQPTSMVTRRRGCNVYTTFGLRPHSTACILCVFSLDTMIRRSINQPSDWQEIKKWLELCVIYLQYVLSLHQHRSMSKSSTTESGRIICVGTWNIYGTMNNLLGLFQAFLWHWSILDVTGFFFDTNQQTEP